MTATPPQPAPRRKLSRRKKLAFAALSVILSTTVALALGEFVARWTIEGSFLEAVDSITGLRTAAGSGEPPLVADPDLGFKLNPETEGVNSLGLRHGELAAAKPALRVLLLGDSISFPMEGYYRDLDAAFRARVEGAEVINASVHGYTTYQERVFLERDLLALEPDLVILQYCINDNYRFLHRLTSKGRRLMTLEAKNYLFPEGDGVLPWLTRSSYLVYSLRKLLLGTEAHAASRFPWDDQISRAAWTDATWGDQERHIRSMAASLERVGGQLAVLAAPAESQLDDGLLQADRDYTVKPQLELRGICARLGLPYLDPHAEFLAHRDAELFTDGLHLTSAGHRLMGRLLVEFLEEEGLLPD